MKNPRKSLFYILLTYLLIQFFLTLYVDSRQNDLGFLINVKNYIPVMKYYTFLGVVLLLVYYLAVMRSTSRLRKAVEKAKEEHTMLKAKLFDLQEASRKDVFGGDLPKTKKEQAEKANQDTPDRVLGAEKDDFPGKNDDTEEEGDEEDRTANKA